MQAIALPRQTGQASLVSPCTVLVVLPTTYVQVLLPPYLLMKPSANWRRWGQNFLALLPLTLHSTSRRRIIYIQAVCTSTYYLYVCSSGSQPPLRAGRTWEDRGCDPGERHLRQALSDAIILRTPYPDPRTTSRANSTRLALLQQHPRRACTEYKASRNHKV